LNRGSACARAMARQVTWIKNFLADIQRLNFLPIRVIRGKICSYRKNLTLQIDRVFTFASLANDAFPIEPHVFEIQQECQLKPADI
jgi:hypothetical protein